MKTLVAVALSVILLIGCGKNNADLSPAIDLRQQLNGSGCSFCADITADYGDRVYTFTMTCKAESSGDVRFEVVKPDTLTGICGTISQSGGKLEFDEKVLLFEPLTQGQLTPVIAPWLMYKVITGGYIRTVSNEGERFVYTIDDTYRAEKIMALLTLENNAAPISCEIFEGNRRILTVQISDFQVL